MPNVGPLFDIPGPEKGVSQDVYDKLMNAEARDVAVSNKAMRAFVTRLGRSDRFARIWRLLLVGVIAIGLVVAGALLALEAIRSQNLGTGIAALATVAVLAVGAFLNPLQTIERDIIYRRWSDTIVAGYYSQLANGDTKLADVRLAGRRAAEQFAVLGVTHQKVAAGSADAIAAILTASAKDAEDGEGATEDGKVKNLSLTAPADVESVAGTLIDAFAIEATGPESLVFVSEGHPDGVDFKTSTGQYSGTPKAAAEPVPVTVTVTSESPAKTATATFNWTVKAA
jgi:hypothetical protein